ncbi:MAG TPA: hypothetical protein VL463_26200 [Kofleriaceae bacterium]|nr:hypothetical protein [Kofleriaceae bacterium]
MDSTVKPPQPGRLLQALQPAIVKLYRIAGMAALGAILIGLILFLTGTIFWYFNRTWVRPVILSPEHAKVMSATNALSEAKMQQDAMVVEKATAEAQLKTIDKKIEIYAKEETELGPQAAAKPNDTTLRVSYDRAVEEHADAELQRPVVEQHVKQLEANLVEQEKKVGRLAASPYIRANEEKRVVGFVPYQNLSNIHPGVTLYTCDWGLIKCHSVGKVLSILEGEVQDVHPHDDSVQRGVMVEVDLTDPDAATENVMFAGSKPFWWL